MKRKNGQLLNKVLAVALSASLVFTLTPSTAIADLSAGGSADASSSAPVSSQAAAPQDDSLSTGAQADGPNDASMGAASPDAASGSEVAPAADSTQPTASEAALPSDLTTFDLVEIEPVSREELTAMLAASPAAASPSLLAGEGATVPEYPEELDGTKVEQISVEWITRDTVEDGDNSRLSLIPGDDEPFNVRMRLNMALSGEHDYEAGDIQVSVPKSIFETRDGKAAGTLLLSVPEAPDARATFNYTDMGDYYLLTNTRKLAAATSAMFEFTIKDIIPHTIVDGMPNDNEPGYDKAYATAPFEGTVQVTTYLGNTVAKSSNQIDCVIDTSEKVVNATKRAVSLSEEWPDSWPASLKPENADDYIYVDWATASHIVGNQAFDMKVEENAHTNVSEGTLLLGYKDSKSGNLYKGDGTLSMEQTLQTGGYVSSGSGAFGGHAYVAYPKSNFEVNKHYKIDNTVTYTLTSADDGTVTKATAKGQVVYDPVAFKAPEGLYHVSKEGDGSVRTLVDGDVEGVYGYALNQLRNGENVDLSYRITAKAFTMPSTADPAGDPDDPDTYHKRAVDLRLVDDETHFNFNNEALTADDFEFKSVRVGKPSMLLYKKFSQTGPGYTGSSLTSQTIQGGTYGYADDADPASIPVLYVYGKAEGGDWVRCATLDWSSGSLKASAENGATVSGTTVGFPAGTVDYKIELSTMRDGIFLWAYPTMTLKATDAVKSQVEALYANTDQPTTKTNNTVKLEATGEDGGTFASFPATGRDKLDGASLAVVQDKEARYESDPGEACVNIHYTTTVYEQSNLTDSDSYNQAVAAGVIQAETEGTFYDLLPMGVQVLTDSVRLRSDDTITSVQAIEDYKGSGRTMLIVKAKLTPRPSFEGRGVGSLTGYCDKITLSFDAKYAWTSLADYGINLNNVVSFESGNDQLGTIKNYSGEPDNPLAGNHYNSKFATTGVEDLMTNLDPDRDTNSFTYANCNTELVIDTAAVTGLLKRVSVNNDGYFDTGLHEDYPRNVYEGGRYTYSLRMQNTEESSSHNIVIYDNLENYVPTSEKNDYQDTQWRGTFSGVDVSQLKAKGINPVVYYSTKSGLVLDDTNNRADMDLSNTAIWSTVCPDDKSTITAIAIDATKDTEGNDFHLEKGDSIVSYVHMVAPRVRDLATPGEEGQWYDTALSAGQTEKGLTGGAHAYNNVSMTATMISAAGVESLDQLVRNDYVKVGLIPFNIETTKVWSDNNNQDGKRPGSVTVHLYANGKDTGKSQVLSADNGWTCDWTATYDDLSPVDGKGVPIIYTFVEDEVPGYTLSVSKKEVDGVSKYTLTNKHTPEKTSLSVTKKWDDGDNAAGARPDSITLNLYREDELYRTQKVTPDASGEWSYTFKELDKYKDGVEVNYSVEEELVPGYIATYGEGGLITNKYYPYGDLTLSKTVENATSASVDKSFTFTLSLTNANGEVDTGDYAYTTSDGRSGTIAAGGSITLKGGQTATIKDLPSESTYSITEVAADGYTATSISGRTGIIRAGQTAQASFTNTYESAGSVQLKAKKVLTGRTLANKQFSFQVLDENGDALRTAACKADGSVAFGLIKYNSSDDGKTYTYYIQEKVPADAVNAEGVTWEDATEAQKIAGGFSKKGYTYDSSMHRVKVSVSDNGDGTMKTTAVYDDGDVPRIENAYKATGSVTLNLWKTLAARDLKDGEFTFGLFDEQGNAIVDKDGKAITAKNAADGTVTFPTLSYDQTNVGQSITYVAKEIIPNKGQAGYDDTVVYDTTEWKFRVSVYDNGDGTLSFDQTSVSPDGEEGKLPVIANTLKPGDLTISKVATNGNPGQEFKFLVKLTNPTGESLDGDYTFKREEGIPQTVDFTTVDIDGAALPGVEYTVYKVAPDGSRTVIGNYVSDDDGNVNIQGLDKFEEGYSYIARVTSVPDGYKMPKNPDITLTQDSTTGTWSSTVTVDSPNSQAYAYYDEATQTLTLTRAKDINSLPTGKQGNIDYFNLQDLEEINVASEDAAPWNNYRADMQTVVIKNRIAPKSMTAWFTNCSNLESIQGMNLLDDSNVERMGSTFSGCKKLTELDLSSFTGVKLWNMYKTFLGCSNLKTIYSSEKFSTAKVTRYDSCFTGCTSLVGGAGTTYSSSNVGAKYAHIDGGPSNPGYFTNIADKPAGASALAAFASKVRAAIDQVNAASARGVESAASSASADEGISPQATTASGTCGTCVWEFGNDGVFTIKPANGVEGTLDAMSYYNRSGAILVPWDGLDKSGITQIKIEGTVHAGKYVEAMFRNFSNVESIDLTGFDTSAVESMRIMFNGCGKLASLDLSGFKTSNVTNMNSMFGSCASLTSLDLSGFDTSQVTNMENMFSSCSSLASLKLSGFNTSRVTSMGWMFYGCKSLESLDLSSFSTPLLTSMKHAFNGCASLKSLDVRNFDTSNVAVGGMLTGCVALSKIVLGDAPFCKGSDAVAALPDPSPASQFTGKWVCEDDSSIALDAWTLSNSHPSVEAPAGTWVWQEKPNTYTVTFDANGGSGAMAKQSYKVNTEYQLPANSFYLFAKKFVGWNTAADGSGTWYDDGVTVRDLAGVGGNATLYAQWADDSSGTLTDGKMEVTLHGNESLTIPNLPAGTQYQVYEQTPSGWVLVKQGGEAGVIEPLKNSQAMFVNDYQPGKTQATIVGTKTVDGDAGKVNAGDYSFELRDSGGMLLETVSCGAGGSIAFAPITYEAAGTWTYKVKEVVPQDKGDIEYDTHEETVTVTVTDDGAGNLSSSVQYDSSGVAFDNHDATPTTGHLKITKTVEGSADTSKEFTFDVVTIKDGVRNTQQVTVRAGETVDLGEFPAGMTYTVTETDIPAGYTLKGTTGDTGIIVAEQTQEAVFTNTYAATGSAALSATKRLTGGALAAGQFSFELRDEAGNVLQTVTNDADGAVSFEPISYTAAGTYHYTIAEVVPGQGDTGFDAAIAYDTHVEDVTVNVTDKGNGTLFAAVTYDKDGAVFENSVKPGAIQLTKTVTGATDVVAGKKFPFKLVLKDGQGNPLEDTFPYRNSDGATGTVKSGDVIDIAADQTVTVEGIPAGTAYSFVEQVPDGFTQKTSDATEGVVGADATASASVENEYATSGSWTPDATKVLEGSELASGQFSFLLLDGEGNVVQTAKNDADGKVVFQAIQYTGEDHGKTFKYSIVEVNDGQDNFTYDDHTAKVSVTVTDNGDGTMTVTPVYGTGDEGNIFTNLWKLIMPETGDTSFLRCAGLGILVVLISSMALALRRRRNEERARVHWR